MSYWIWICPVIGITILSSIMIVTFILFWHRKRRFAKETICTEDIWNEDRYDSEGCKLPQLSFDISLYKIQPSYESLSDESWDFDFENQVGKKKKLFSFETRFETLESPNTPFKVSTRSLEVRSNSCHNNNQNVRRTDNKSPDIAKKRKKPNSGNEDVGSMEPKSGVVPEVQAEPNSMVFQQTPESECSTLSHLCDPDQETSNKSPNDIYNGFLLLLLLIILYNIRHIFYFLI